MPGHARGLDRTLHVVPEGVELMLHQLRETRRHRGGGLLGAGPRLPAALDGNEPPLLDQRLYHRDHEQWVAVRVAVDRAQAGATPPPGKRSAT